jgi:hypothetical protein
LLPHAEQLLTLVFRLVSHPFEALPSQLPQPAVQEIEHVPPEQLATPLALLQVCPQPPQLPMLVPRFTSQPLAGLLSQSA